MSVKTKIKQSLNDLKVELQNKESELMVQPGCDSYLMGKIKNVSDKINDHIFGIDQTDNHPLLQSEIRNKYLGYIADLKIRINNLPN